MERPIFKPIGTPLEELDTPALVVDLAVMQTNIEAVHSFFRSQDAKVRPDVSIHRCPAIAHRQLAVNGHAGGICVATLGEAETFAQAGFSDIFIRNHVATGTKIARLCALARSVRVSVAVDNPANAGQLSEAAQAHGVTVRALVEVNSHPSWCGVEPGQPAVALCKKVDHLQGLTLAGLTTNVSLTANENPEMAAARAQQAVQIVLDTLEMVERAGLPVATVSVSGANAYQAIGTMSGVTEVALGKYPLMDATCLRCCPHMRPAAKVLSTVTSHPTRDRAIADAGHKALSSALGVPIVEGHPGARPARLSAEHCLIELEGSTVEEIVVGERLWLIPSDIGETADLHDYIFAGQDGRLAAVWEVAARGLYA